MKIIVISTPIFKLGYGGLISYGGLEQIAWQQAAGLAARGHQVKLIAPDGSVCPGVEIISIGPERQIDEGMAYGGYPEVKDRIDIGNNQAKEYLVRRGHKGYWNELLECDCILDHSWGKFSYLLKMEGRLKAPILGWMHAPVNTMYQSLPSVDNPCFVSISEDQRQHFEVLHNRPARTCYNGVDCEYYKPLTTVRTNRYLFLARFSTIKGPHIAIEACKEAGVGLDLIGDTSITNEPEYLKKCLSMADGKQIRFLGSCSRGETVYWFSQAHGLLHSAQSFREPFGLAPVEAQACGCPVLTFDNGAMRETVKHGETGFVVKTVKEMIEHIKHDSIKKLYRTCCREWAKQFSVDRMINRVEELCKEAITTGGW
jgi:glycosyltransferase involved in cell wall biosynthesis